VLQLGMTVERSTCATCLSNEPFFLYPDEIRNRNGNEVSHFTKALPTVENQSTLPLYIGVRLVGLVQESLFLRVFDGMWMDTKVAVKAFKSKQYGLPAQFGDSVLESFSHPNIVQMFACSTCELSFDVWTVHEWCDRGSLSQYCKTSRCDEQFIPEVFGIGLDVTSAGCYMHSRNVIHGSLTANSVLLKTDASDRKGYVCKIGDLSVLQRENRGSEVVGVHMQNSRPTVCLPPEYFRSDESDVSPTRSEDVYATGIVLWQVLTGVIPFEGMTDVEIREEVRHGLQLPLEGVREDFKNIVNSCISSDPRARPGFHELVRTFMSCGLLTVICSQRAQVLEKHLCKLLTTVVQDEATQHSVTASA
jgi:serine/threonine protein kinase